MTGTRVYVGGLSSRANERDIDRFFKNYSRLGDIVIKKGFAFVEFNDNRDAEDAIYEMNGKELLGGRVTVEKARGTPRNSWQRGSGGSQQRGNRPPQRQRYGVPSRTGYRLAVENLSSKVSWQDLKDFMRQAGEVTYADAHKNRKNEGIVEFTTHSDMRNALIKLDGKELNGRRIHLVDESRRGYDRDSRTSRRSRSGSRSRSRSRSNHSRSYSRSRSRSNRRSRSKSASRSASRSRSRSPARTQERKKLYESRDRSNSDTEKPRRKTNSRSESRSASRSRSRERTDRQSRSHSRERTDRPNETRRGADYRSYSKSPNTSMDDKD